MREREGVNRRDREGGSEAENGGKSETDGLHDGALAIPRPGLEKFRANTKSVASRCTHLSRWLSA